MDNMNTNEPNITPPPPSAALFARWTLNPVQAAFLTSDARFSFYVGGVGAGKTTAGALRALVWALDHPGSLGLIGAPTYPMLRDATRAPSSHSSTSLLATTPATPTTNPSNA